MSRWKQLVLRSLHRTIVSILCKDNNVMCKYVTCCMSAKSHRKIDNSFYLCNLILEANVNSSEKIISANDTQIQTTIIIIIIINIRNRHFGINYVEQKCVIDQNEKNIHKMLSSETFS